jgi:hypothetical protein
MIDKNGRNEKDIEKYFSAFLSHFHTENKKYNEPTDQNGNIDDECDDTIGYGG